MNSKGAELSLDWLTPLSGTESLAPVVGGGLEWTFEVWGQNLAAKPG